MTGPFSLTAAAIPLPKGAFAGWARHVLRFEDRPIAAVTTGEFRPYLHPVWSPQGYVVTAERPADHPHHCGIWCAADHVALMMEGSDRIERYDYNFYVDAVFQGRAPARIVMRELALAEQSGETAVLEQRLDWLGPREWSAAEGRPVLAERRRTTITAMPDATIFDVVSEIECASACPVEIGPTRHAYFNARLADAITLTGEGRLGDDRGRRGAADIGADPRWVDFRGPVGGGHVAGLAVAPHETEGNGWFMADWGVVTVGSMRAAGLAVAPGRTVRLGCRFVAHDGDLDIDGLAERLPIPLPSAEEDR